MIADEGIFLEYFLSTKAFKIYNLRTRTIIESINVSFDDGNIAGIQDEEEYDSLRFKNEVPISDRNANSDGTASFDNIADVNDSSSDNDNEDHATVEGEQQHDDTTTTHSSENNSSEFTSLENTS